MTKVKDKIVNKSMKQCNNGKFNQNKNKSF